MGGSAGVADRWLPLPAVEGFSGFPGTASEGWFGSLPRAASGPAWQVLDICANRLGQNYVDQLFSSSLPAEHSLPLPQVRWFGSGRRRPVE
ncbi:hypothetical protein GCM10009599_08920 [Luteococcus peritonei]